MTVTSLILGLDVSPRRLGWGLVDLVTGAPVACGMEPIDLPDHGWQHQQIARALEQVPAYGFPLSDPRLLCEIQAVYIEQPMCRFPGASYAAGRAVQSAHSEVERRWPWAPIENLNPKEWRKEAGLKGNATKAEVMLHAATLVPVDFLPGADNSASGTTVLDAVPQDAADALLIAVAGWHRNEDTVARAAEWAERA